ncbi:MAG: FtsX-like permease family protein [Clostridiaceae bacterium]|jgi:putative ABC transport system permease protein|nr:FtsX-like permease family protein [Clostridiaceae bacterium]
MNIVNRLTIRQLKLNRKRTLVTILGAIISVAMITAVCTLGISFLDFMQRITIADEGEWHVLYKGVHKEQLEAIQNDEETKTVILSRDTGYAYLNGSQNPNKPYIFIMEYNKHGFERFPIKLIEGRFPERPDEIIISEAIITNGKVDYKIGDILTFDIGRRYSSADIEYKQPLSQRYALQKDNGRIQETLSKETSNTYTITGIMERPSWEPAWSPGYTALSYVDESFIHSSETINASVIVKKVNPGLFEHGKNLASQNGIDEVDFNHSLLRYYGVISDDQTKNMLFTLSSIIMVIIIIGSVSLIYNAFAISVSDRARYLGMLSSVGATKKQKRNSVFFEGAVIGAVSIPVGILAGFAGIGITFFFINPIINNLLTVSGNFRVVVFPSTIIIAVLISLSTIFISTWVPARRASNISAIDAIRQTADVKLTGKEVKTSKLTRSIFGIEADLALKNLKRYKGRYRTTIFSLVISIVLFLVVSQFTLNLKKSLILAQDGINFDIMISFYDSKNELQEDLIRKINSFENITKSTQIKTFEAISYIDIDSAADFLKEGNGDLENDKMQYQVHINALDDDSLKAYAKEIGADFSRLKDANNPSAVVVDTIKYKDIAEDKYIETKIIKLEKEDMLTLRFYDWETEEEVEMQSLKTAVLTDKVPMGIIPGADYANLHVIVSEDALEKIVAGNEIAAGSVNTQLFLDSTNPLKLQESIESIQNSVSESYFSLYNLYIQKQKQEQLIMLMSVFTYGFIALITAICIANILNTITTSIALRKREFAMLKSVGITPGGFNKMINYESVFYGLKAVLFGMPISFAVMYGIHLTLSVKFGFPFALPWTDVFIATAAVFVIVGIAMLYSGAKIKKENIIDVLKQEII